MGIFGFSYPVFPHILACRRLWGILAFSYNADPHTQRWPSESVGGLASSYHKFPHARSRQILRACFFLHLRITPTLKENPQCMKSLVPQGFSRFYYTTTLIFLTRNFL